MKFGMSAAVLAMSLLAASSVSAATSKFDLMWSSTSGISTTDATMKAVGTLEVAVGAGESFGLSDLVSINVNVTGDTINDFTIDGSENTKFLTGQVTSDGMFAQLTDFLFANFVDPFVGNGFGCDFDDPSICAPGNFDGGPDYNIVSGRLTNPTDVNGNKGTTTYANAGRALGSIGLTKFVAQPDPDPLPTPEVVPLPATAPLLLGAIGALAFWRRRRAAKA